jgi:hypothetical protein
VPLDEQLRWYETYYQEKAAEATEQKRKEEKNLSPRNRKACHNISTALMQSLI